ncbi:winged helix-turn-helix domain-containing protein [Sphingopyxis sp.]|uniref:protein kinase domain-containing protein n=1 Tax=Sphingopyxis sp. TaxID=1908224 RepID=UPI0035ADB008
MSGTHNSRRRRRIWRFAGAEFDEASWTLRVAGTPVSLEGKPLELLHELLLRAGEVVTKDEILDAVWPGVTVVEGSLATAISKLRKALGGAGADVIATVPRVGYRLVAAVEVESIETPLAPRFAFAAGDSVPGRKAWQLDRPLGDTGAEDVWLARQAKTGEQRVFKFADAPDRLRALKREAALSRLVSAGLGKASPLPALHEWNFDAAPFFLEYAWGGQDLLAWAEAAGGLPAIPLADRLAVAAMAARAVADIHGVGVLHKDLKPANMLIDEAGDEQVLRLVDFGSGRLIDDALLASFQITNPGSLDADLGKDEPRSGTLAYRAPELVGDAVPTVKSDVYALGLILYQLVVGDFTAALAPGWEAQVADPLLRDDIARAAAGLPEDRLASAADLAERIERLDDRRAAAAEAAERAAFLADQKRRDERRAAQRPWVRAAFASLTAGLLATSALAAYALHQRNRAVTARELAETSYAFVAEDVLGSADPAKSSADETVVDAIKRASGQIDQRFAGKPGIAARLHLAVARAFHQRSDPDTARTEYARTDALFAKAGESDSDDAITGRLDRINMEATSGQPDRLEEAGRLLEKERALIGKRGDSGRMGFALARAEGSWAYFADIEQAERAFRRAVAIGSTAGGEVQPGQLLKARSSLVLTLMRLGRAAEAEPIARAIVADSVRIRGADHPDTLVTRQHWLNSLAMTGRYEEALKGSVPLLAAMEKRFGPDHRFTLGLRSTRFEGYSALGRYGEAAAEAKRVWEGAAAQAGPHSHQALVGQIDYASALCQTPQREQALGLTRDALAASLAGFGADFALTHSIRYFTAECMIANQRFAEAGQMLRNVDREKVAQLLGNPDFDATVDVALAEVAIGKQDKTEAQRMLDKAAPALARTKDEILRARAEKLGQSLAS